VRKPIPYPFNQVIAFQKIGTELVCPMCMKPGEFDFNEVYTTDQVVGMKRTHYCSRCKYTPVTGPHVEEGWDA
jgi:hypothetical protein